MKFLKIIIAKYLIYNHEHKVNSKMNNHLFGQKQMKGLFMKNNFNLKIEKQILSFKDEILYNSVYHYLELVTS